jgi:N-hydroxyarylamine O-acetyltransferase
MDVDAYLDRIGYSGSVVPTAATLRGIHRAHMLAVPFENLDIARGRRIVLDPEASLRKIVDERRGGFCYELNGAFATLLQGLGFKVSLLSARVAREQGGFGPEFDHLTLRVDLEPPWLADVGFGDSFVEPLQLLPGLEQEQDGRKFRIIQDADIFTMESSRPDGSWHREYAFTLQPRKLQDFAGMCHYHQTSPESSFTRKSVCSRATPDGRITLSGLKLITTKNGQRQERELASEEEWYGLLQQHFGIVLTSPSSQSQ